MEWPQETGVVRSGIALHAGRLLEQYEGLTREDHPAARHEATLTICVLQTMLTNCWELFLYLDGREQSKVLGPLDEYINSLLSDRDEVKFSSSFPDDAEGLSARAFIKHTRNALSHPRFRVTEPPTTGYKNLKDDSGLIKRIELVDSPHLNGKGDFLKRYKDLPGVPWVFTVELPVTRLTALALTVALALSQPALDNWDSPVRQAEVRHHF